MLRKFYRYSDLVEAGIVSNRVTLSRWIDKRGFPAPLELGPNTRGFPADEVDAWLSNRPRAKGGETVNAENN